MNVAGYVRVSTEKQMEEERHITQREWLRDWADREGHEIEIFEDIAISRKNDDRPEYEEMMKRSTDGEFDAVVVRELSRFGRSLQKVLNDIKELDKNDVDFISLTEKFDTGSAMGKAMMQMIGVFNEFWANMASERAQKNVERRRERGEPIGRPKKLNEGQREQVIEWHEMGLGYSSIASLVEDGFGIEIDRSTIYRYCKEAEADD